MSTDNQPSTSGTGRPGAPRSTRRALAGALATTCLATLGLMASPAMASEMQPMACVMSASLPSGNKANLSGTGSRTGCSTSATVWVRLKKDRTGPDAVLSTVSGTGTNVTRTASAGNVGAGKFYTETQSSTGGLIQSERRTLT